MSSVVISGDVSGSVTLQAPSAAGTTVLTLPATSGTVVTTATSTGISGSAITTGTVGVSVGGTGANTLTANNVILGNGTSAVQFVAPGSSGNVLTSNGTTWTSAAAGGGQLQTQLFTSPGTWTKPASCTQVRVTVVGGGGGSVAAVPSLGGYGGAIIAANVPVSSPVAVTVGSGGVGAPGGTSSFGSGATATGGAQGGNPGTGANGTGTTTGTDIKSGAINTFSGNLGLIYGGTARNSTVPTVQTYSSTSALSAGVGGQFNNAIPAALPGVSGAVLVEFVG